MNVVTPLKAFPFDRLPLSDPESPLYDLTFESLSFLHDDAVLTTSIPVFLSAHDVQPEPEKPPAVNVDAERRFLEDPLDGRTSYFTKEREALDLKDINGAWLEGKQTSQQARQVLAEKRMLRRLTKLLV